MTASNYMVVLEDALRAAETYREALESTRADLSRVTAERDRLHGVLCSIAATRLDGEPDELGEDESMDIGDAFRILSQVVTVAREVTR